MVLYIDPFRYARSVSNVKRIYREEASRLHPDKHPKASNSQKKVYTRRFQEMALSYDEAMQRVSDPAYRASEELRRREEEHDREHDRRERNRMRQAKERKAAEAAREAAEAEAARVAAARAAEAAREAYKKTPEYAAQQAAKYEATTKLFAARHREVVGAKRVSMMIDPNLSTKRAKPGHGPKSAPRHTRKLR